MHTWPLLPAALLGRAGWGGATIHGRWRNIQRWEQASVGGLLVATQVSVVTTSPRPYHSICYRVFLLPGYYYPILVSSRLVPQYGGAITSVMLQRQASNKTTSSIQPYIVRSLCNTTTPITSVYAATIQGGLPTLILCQLVVSMPLPHLSVRLPLRPTGLNDRAPLITLNL